MDVDFPTTAEVLFSVIRRYDVVLTPGADQHHNEAATSLLLTTITTPYQHTQASHKVFRHQYYIPDPGNIRYHQTPLSANMAPIDDGKGQNPLTFVTSTLGNGVGGVSKTAGGIVGATGRGLGQTVTGVTGSMGKPVGDALESVGNGIEGGTKSVAEGVEDAGKGKKDIFH